MENAENLQRKHSLFTAAAILAPMTQAASGEGWLGVLLMALAACLLGRWCRGGIGWLLAVQKVWCCLLIGFIMRWSTYVWQGLAFVKAVPFVLLVLAAWTVSVPRKAQRIGCVLLWPLLLLLGGVLLSGVSEIKLSRLMPVWQIPKLTLFAVLLLPGISSRGRGPWKLGAGAVVISIITVGVLSLGISREVPSGIYELSRSLSFLGIAERFESLVAAAMTMGFFSSMTYLLEMPDEDVRYPWIYAAIGEAFYLIKVPENGWLLAAGSVFVWLILPGLQAGKIISKNGKKGIDKSGSPW